MELPRCPACVAAKRKQKTKQLRKGVYKCLLCGGLFDDEPDEGGTHSNRNVSIRLEREERHAARRR